jgi:hypothetical protein
MAGIGAPQGNQYAAKAKQISDRLRKLCVQEDYQRLETALNRQLDKAAEGDLAALTFIRDTSDGKPAQQVDVAGSGENGEHLISVIRRVIVDPAKS